MKVENTEREGLIHSVTPKLAGFLPWRLLCLLVSPLGESGRNRGTSISRPWRLTPGSPLPRMCNTATRTR